MENRVNIDGQWWKWLAGGKIILAVTSALWIHILFEIKRMPLPVNCAGAWPDDLPIIVFIQFLLLLPPLYFKSKMEKTVNPVTATLIMLDFTSLTLLFSLSCVVALCVCSDPSVIDDSYKTVAIVYIIDSGTKTYFLFSKAKTGATEQKKG